MPTIPHPMPARRIAIFAFVLAIIAGMVWAVWASGGAIRNATGHLTLAGTPASDPLAAQVIDILMQLRGGKQLAADAAAQCSTNHVIVASRPLISSDFEFVSEGATGASEILISNRSDPKNAAFSLGLGLASLINRDEQIVIEVLASSSDISKEQFVTMMGQHHWDNLQELLARVPEAEALVEGQWSKHQFMLAFELGKASGPNSLAERLRSWYDSQNPSTSQASLSPEADDAKDAHALLRWRAISNTQGSTATLLDVMSLVPSEAVGLVFWNATLKSGRYTVLETPSPEAAKKLADDAIAAATPLTSKIPDWIGFPFALANFDADQAESPSSATQSTSHLFFGNDHKFGVLVTRTNEDQVIIKPLSLSDNDIQSLRSAALVSPEWPFAKVE